MPLMTVLGAPRLPAAQVYSGPRVRELQRLLNGTCNAGVKPGYEVRGRASGKLRGT